MSTETAAARSQAAATASRRGKHVADESGKALLSGVGMADRQRVSPETGLRLSTG